MDFLSQQFSSAFSSSSSSCCCCLSRVSRVTNEKRFDVKSCVSTVLLVSQRVSPLPVFSLDFEYVWRVSSTVKE